MHLHVFGHEDWIHHTRIQGSSPISPDLCSTFLFSSPLGCHLPLLPLNLRAANPTPPLIFPGFVFLYCLLATKHCCYWLCLFPAFPTLKYFPTFSIEKYPFQILRKYESGGSVLHTVCTLDVCTAFLASQHSLFLSFRQLYLVSFLKLNEYGTII